MANDQDNKEYKGPGKTMSAVGRGGVEMLAGQAIGVAGALAASKDARVLFTGTENMEQLIKGSKKLGITVGILGLIGLIHGLYKGGKNAAIAKQQVTDLNAELDHTKSELAQQKSFVETLNKERLVAETAKQR